MQLSYAIHSDSSHAILILFTTINLFIFQHPRDPPEVTMLSRIGHPCVSSNNRVNLDILNHEDGIAQNTSQRYQMWSPAYTVSSVLIQLQGTFN